jgi:hypothetical protein
MWKIKWSEVGKTTFLMYWYKNQYFSTLFYFSHFYDKMVLKKLWYHVVLSTHNCELRNSQKKKVPDFTLL